MRKDRGALRVVETVANGPAERAGIRPGTIIQAINGAPAAMLTDDDAGKLIRGPAGTTVELDVSDEGAPNWHKLRLVREAIVVGVYYRMLDRGIGVLSITGFNKQTPASVRQALGALAAAGAHGLVIDLRNSSPGLSAITEAEVAGFFVGNAVPLWLERDYGQAKATPIQSSQRRIWNQPVVVLINEGTNRNSVRLASALRSAGRASLVGRKTAGASAIEWFEKQPDGSARRTSMKLIFTLRDEPISGQGLTPDVVLDASLSAEEQLSRAAAVLAPLPPIGRTEIGRH
jgi:carboxyl-terminal processing protease